MVWIPRYAYQIETNYYTSTAGTINVKFLKRSSNIASDDSTVELTPTYSGSSQTNYIQHPSFIFGITELTGFGVAKFEASVSDTGNACYVSPSAANCNTTTLSLKVVPGVSSWKYIDVGNMFTVSREMETNDLYGWGTTGNGINTHMMKNTEWGAAAYLSKSHYGKNSEIWINNSSTYVTGCVGNSVSEPSYYGCQNHYDTPTGINASTTGNIYGICDMSGGSYEKVSAYLNNGSFTLTTYGNSIIISDNMYKNLYDEAASDLQVEHYALTINKKGDALYETSAGTNYAAGWFGDYIDMPYGNSAWISRGGYYGHTTQTGIFNSRYSSGNQGDNRIFRPVLLVGFGFNIC